MIEANSASHFRLAFDASSDMFGPCQNSSFKKVYYCLLQGSHSSTQSGDSEHAHENAIAGRRVIDTLRGFLRPELSDNDRVFE